MIGVSLEEAIERLKKNDNRTLEDRANRLAELGTYTISLVNRPVANLMGQYQEEASFSYVNGNFRSCIFSCSAVIDQIFRHEIIRESSDYEGTLDQIKNLTFGPIIGMARNEKIESLKPILGEANWINEARKKIAVHPICITAEKLDDKLSNKLKVDFINNVLEIADEETKEKILSLSVKYPNEKRITLPEVLKNPYSKRASEFLMWGHHNRIIEYIALDVYKRTVRVLLHLFPAEQMCI